MLQNQSFFHSHHFCRRIDNLLCPDSAPFQWSRTHSVCIHMAHMPSAEHLTLLFPDFIEVMIPDQFPKMYAFACSTAFHIVSLSVIPMIRSKTPSAIHFSLFTDGSVYFTSGILGYLGMMLHQLIQKVTGFTGSNIFE